MIEKKLKNILQCARMYYEEDLDQQQISKKMNLSKATVWRYLKAAKEHLDIKITYKSENENPEYIINKIKKSYNLVDLRIAYDSLRINDSPLPALGIEAGLVIDEIINKTNDRTVICIPGGTTMFHLAENLRTMPRNIDIYPLVLFPRGSEIVRVDASTIVTLFWTKSRPSARGFFLPTPREDFIDLNKERNALYQKMYERANIFIVTLGPAYGFGKENASSYVNINGHNIDKRTHLIEPVHHYAFPYELFKELKEQNRIVSICVAAGKKKIDAIKIVLENNLVDILIIDYMTALDLLIE